MLQEAMSKEDWERQEKGLSPLKRVRVARPEPEKPKMDNEVKMADIPEGYTIQLEQAFKKIAKNAEGMSFIGFEVLLNLTPIPRKRGPGRPKEDEVEPESKTLMGWMDEGQFLALLRTYSKQIDRQVIRW